MAKHGKNISLLPCMHYICDGCSEGEKTCFCGEPIKDMIPLHNNDHSFEPGMCDLMLEMFNMAASITKCNNDIVEAIGYCQDKLGLLKEISNEILADIDYVDAPNADELRQIALNIPKQCETIIDNLQTESLKRQVGIRYICERVHSRQYIIEDSIRNLLDTTTLSSIYEIDKLRETKLVYVDSKFEICSTEYISTKVYTDPFTKCKYTIQGYGLYVSDSDGFGTRVFTMICDIKNGFIKPVKGKLLLIEKIHDNWDIHIINSSTFKTEKYKTIINVNNAENRKLCKKLLYRWAGLEEFYM